MKATEKSKITAETMDKASCSQKLNHPVWPVEFEAASRALLATSDTGITSVSASVRFVAKIAGSLCTKDKDFDPANCRT